jgi:hypothetical protein
LSSFSITRNRQPFLKCPLYGDFVQ